MCGKRFVASITASKLYDYLQCPHKVWRDIFGPQEEIIHETNPFIQLLWERGLKHERDVVLGLGDVLDLSEGSLEDRFNQTIQAINNRVPLIYQGVLIIDELIGIPDLLRLSPEDSYIPIDIKSGMGREGADEAHGNEGSLKKHYAVQLALYVDALVRLGYKIDKTGLIIDSKCEEVKYDLSESIGQRNPLTYWELYEDTKEQVELLINNDLDNKPALGGICKLCPWYNSCNKWVVENDDLTNLFYLGRSKRDTLESDINITRIQDIFKINVSELLDKKKKDKQFLKGLGKATIEKIVQRAEILKNKQKPIIYSKLDFPCVSYELFFDIEDDPTQEFVYLHGVYERSKHDERFVDFTAKSVDSDAEKDAWRKFWEYIDTLPESDISVYYYSSHEKSTYRRLQKKYPDVISEDKVEAFFDHPNTIDLYSIVLKNTDWPLGSYSLKSIAVYLGFKWRDESPSGALSIQWFNEYLETENAEILDRILMYNEDDCKATMVIKDALNELSNQIL